MKNPKRVSPETRVDIHLPGNQTGVEGSWRRVLSNDPTEWLLDQSNPSVRYWTLVDLLDKSPDDPLAQEAAASISQMPLVLYMIARQNRKGLWGEERDYFTPKHYSTFWVLSTLGDIGVSADTANLRQAIDYMLTHQGDDGAFRRRQTTTGRPEVEPLPCTQARITRFLVQFGYGDGPAVKASIDWLVVNQRADGSWICNPTKQQRHGCLRATHDFLRLASLLPSHRQHPAVTRAAFWLADRLLDPRTGRFKVKNLWLQFTFPVFEYHLVSATEALARLGLGLEHSRIAEAARAIMAKQTNQGPWLIDAEPVRPPANFGRAGEPGKWVTLDAMRTLKWLYSQGSH